MPYLLLAVAIALELVGTSFLKMSAGFTKLWPTLGCIIAYVICFYSFSRALLNINLSIAYATWSAVGIIAATLLSVFIFKEQITFWGVIGIIVVIIGVLMINLCGTK
ncbi:MAG: DMT family transporter [Bacillota bacterium]|jgi:small multidrug resistance pump